MDTVGNKYTLGVLNRSGCAAQSELPALLDLSVNLRQVLLPLELLGPLKTSYFEELHFLPWQVLPYSASCCCPNFLDILNRYKQYNLLYRCHVRGGE